MADKCIVIVGGVAGGMSFATRYRRLNQNDHIIIFEKGPYVSFANCGLPYYVSKEITDRSDLIVAEKEMLEQRFQLDIRVNHEVLSIDKENKLIKVLYDGEIETVAYDTLVLSPGAKPIKLNIEGMENIKGIFTLRNIPDVDRIVEYIEHENPQNAIVIGAGFIGLEMAENLKKRGLNVSVVEKASHVLPPFDEEMAMFAQKELLKNGLNVYTNTSIVKFMNNQAVLEDNTILDVDLVIMAVGVLPETALAVEAGLAVGMKNGIVVNDQYQTSDKNIYAVGDAIVVKHYITKEDTMIPLASPANRQGRQLADILSGLKVKSKGSLGTAIVRLFNLTFASCGLNERQLQGKKYEVVHLLGNDHAGYFPDATSIYLKVIFNPVTQQIYGAQALGEKGVDKRIDVIATAIKAGYPVSDLQELETAYAPPFNSAKDIVNMAGYVASNMIAGITRTVQWHEVEKLQEEGYVVVDVRSEKERRAGYIKDSINMPLDNLRCLMSKLDPQKKIIVYCRSSIRSYNAERILRNAGFDVYNLDGSFAYYKVVKEDRIVKDEM